jgi:CHAT domain-containing protein
VGAFACLGSSNLVSRSASHLLLADHRLTVAHVTRVRLGDADLTFPLACPTARPGGPTDEAIHLTSAFQLAGYRHVIGTLWPIDDQVAVSLADDLYGAVVDAGTVDMAGQQSPCIR